MSSHGDRSRLSRRRLIQAAGIVAANAVPLVAGRANPAMAADRSSRHTPMLVGAASQELSGSDFPALDAVAGPWTIRRSYGGQADGIPRSFADSVAGIDVGKRASVLSLKPDLTAMADGSLDAAVTAFVRSIPAGHRTFLTIWHEADGKIRNGKFTLEAWMAAFKRFCDLVHRTGGPTVYTALILEAWSGQHPEPGSTYEELWPGLDATGCPYADVFSVDGSSDSGSEESLWGPAREFAKHVGVPWAISEIGCKQELSVDWMARNAVYAADHAAAFLCWFSNDNNAVPTPGTDPAADARSHQISLTYYTDPATYVLPRTHR
jgi:hypothetical protein